MVQVRFSLHAQHRLVDKPLITAVYRADPDPCVRLEATHRIDLLSIKQDLAAQLNITCTSHSLSSSIWHRDA